MHGSKPRVACPHRIASAVFEVLQEFLDQRHVSAISRPPKLRQTTIGNLLFWWSDFLAECALIAPAICSTEYCLRFIANLSFVLGKLLRKTNTYFYPEFLQQIS